MTETRGTTGGRSAGSTSGKNDEGVVGQKRKPDAEPSPSRDTKAQKKQITIEDAFEKNQDDSEMKDAEVSEKGQDVGDEAGGYDEVEAKDNSKATPKAEEKKAHTETKPSKSNGEGAIEESSQREKQIPSNMLEKGVIYFFTRNRVGIEDADSVGDLQRTFFVLRPLPMGAKLVDGALPDSKHNRLFALPKKTFPKSHSDRFMAFVEKSNTTIQDLKDNFFAASEYETKTQGTRHTAPITPIAEGVYAITRTEDATTHLVYSTTIPTELGEVQDDLGIKSQGSFIISVKNPERSGPASAQLPQKPDFPKE